MPTLLSGISVALQAMMASQQATRAIEQNVSNANTPGYHRQQAVLKAARAYPPAGLYSGSANAGQVGAGVEVQSIQRFNTDFLDASVRREMSSSEYWTQKSDLLKTVESQLTEVGDNGLLSRLDDFWKGWRDLEADPTNSVLRTDLIERSSSLAEAFKSRVQQLNAIRSDLDQRITPLVSEINESAQQVAELNKQILAIQASGNDPNDLIDQRGQLLESLAKQGGASVNFQSNGQAMVSIGGHALVFGGSANTLQVEPDAANPGFSKVTWAEDGMDARFSKSELSAIFEVRDTVIPDQQLAGLNSVASALITRINTAHSAGFGLNNATGRTLFTGTDAATIQLNTDATTGIRGPDDLAAAAAADSPGDGGNAAILAGVQYETFAALGSLSLNAAYNHQVTKLGLDIQEADKSGASRQLVLDALEEQRQSISGVSLDEEAANLARYQRSYQAAARLMTAVDEMLDRVINGMGRVGL